MKAKAPYLKLTLRVLVIILALSIVGHESRKHFYLNLTESEPVGLYLLSPFKGEARRGDLVLFETPKEYQSYVYGRKWLPNGWPLLKTVGAIAGETFCIEGATFKVSGKRIGNVYSKDRQGLPLPRLTGCYRVRPGYFLPVATHTGTSFDGRYMADVSGKQIIATATPIWTW